MRVTRTIATLTAAIAMALAMILQAMPAAAVTGYDSNFFGESAFVFIAPGGTNQFAVGFTNTGSTGWQTGTASQVNLAVCGITQGSGSCTMSTPSANAAWASNWLSSIAFATTTTAYVGPGQVGWFTYNVTAPSSATPGNYEFDGDLVLASNAAAIHRQGYYQVATVQAVGAPAKLACTATPNSLEVATPTALTSTISVTVQDANGLTIFGSTASITLSQAASATNSSGSLGGGAIGASATVAAVNGVSTFTLSTVIAPSVPISAKGTDQLSAASGALTGCLVNVSLTGAGAATQLSVASAAPAAAGPKFKAGTATTTTITVATQDAGGVQVAPAADTTVTYTVDNTAVCNFQLSAGPPVVTSATATTTILASGAGLSTPATLQITGTAGSCNVTASATGLSTSTLALSTITLGAPSAIVVTSNNSPATITSTTPTPTVKIKVAVQDSSGNTIFTGTGSTDSITRTNPGSCTAAPASPSAVVAVAGVATFSITNATAQTCTFTFTDTTSALTAITTTGTWTGAGSPSTLALSTSPATIPGNGVSQSTITVCVADAAGNTVTSANDSLSAFRSSPAPVGTTAVTTPPVTATSGCASFTIRSNVVTTTTTDTYTATDGSRSLTGVFTTTITVVAP